MDVSISWRNFHGMLNGCPKLRRENFYGYMYRSNPLIYDNFLSQKTSATLDRVISALCCEHVLLLFLSPVKGSALSNFYILIRLA